MSKLNLYLEVVYVKKLKTDPPLSFCATLLPYRVNIDSNARSPIASIYDILVQKQCIKKPDYVGILTQLGSNIAQELNFKQF